MQGFSEYVIGAFMFQTLTINGEVVRDSRFNLAGLVMGVIGAGMAWGALRERLNRDRLRLVLIMFQRTTFRHGERWHDKGGRSCRRRRTRRSVLSVIV